MKKTALALAAVAVASATVLTACSSGDASSTGAAGDGTLSIYAWAGEIPDSVISGFEEETGIQVTVDTFDSNETMISKLAAGNSGYDVVEPSQYAVQLMVERDLVAEIDQSKLEGFDNLAEKFVDPSFDPGNAHSIPWAWGTTGILYNEACTGREITGWADMWDPEFTGKVYMLDNMLSAYIAGLQVNGLSATTTDQAEIETATDSLLEQKPLLGGYNSTNYADLVGTGDACIAEAYSGTTAAKAVEANPDVHYIIPEEGGTLWTDSFSIVKGTSNEDAAYQWLNYTLRPEVAALLTDEASLASTNEAALPLVADQSQVENPAIYAPADSLVKSEFIVDPGDALAYFQDGWTRVRAS
ncbi:spermidine/putrescine ABC transporter substrate-binding protein [Herbiconiux moechotypicola]|uniref:Spermidine/putrescine ABC transporter substrate-binding protein PotD n=1 Tax=Herbiconiux moechotypicola TaxID=637393 RepID=A0ABN3D9E8_9MICO|nr:spermidine/putrescine ABC transporter substrate-binding protein [Herbiconiux moechotypicola]MCS5729078.1 spermidine/putrescine ABC transporter substrate-binding protein [Herbiconiux moechotypicola]